MAALGKRFKEHGARIYGAAQPPSGSPLYAFLSAQVAADPEVLALVADADPTTTITNLFFGAVHYLLLDNAGHPLAEFYPDLTPRPRPIAGAYPAFRAFCLDHAGEIRHLVRTQRVQTNEVRRCAPLLPAFQLVWQRRGGRPLALVEIGTSAGLHLLWDRYGYDYGEAGTAGDPASPVRITCAPRGDRLPPILPEVPAVAYRLGIDIAPIDVRDEQATRWLRALIWPEHADRRALLDAALTLARENPPRIVPGDAADVLPRVLAEVPQDAVLCVYDSYTLNQMPRAVRARILAHLREHGARRPLCRITQEGLSLERPPQVELTTYDGGVVHTELLARCESHGRWIEWVRQD
jgi:hypothetical protein